VAEDVVGEGRPAAGVAVKVRFAPFFTHTPQRAAPRRRAAMSGPPGGSRCRW
jgi:hypothetical protein